MADRNLTTESTSTSGKPEDYEYGLPFDKDDIVRDDVMVTGNFFSCGGRWWRFLLCRDKQTELNISHHQLNAAITSMNSPSVSNFGSSMGDLGSSQTRVKQHGTCIQGNHSDYSHQGALQFAYDFALDSGTAVLAARDGVVARVVTCFKQGGPLDILATKANFIAVRHSDNTYARYYHLRFKGAEVFEGDVVRKGQVLGRSGNTGFSNAPHLHFDVVDMLPCQSSLVQLTLPTCPLYPFTATSSVGSTPEHLTPLSAPLPPSPVFSVSSSLVATIERSTSCDSTDSGSSGDLFSQRMENCNLLEQQEPGEESNCFLFGCLSVAGAFSAPLPLPARLFPVVYCNEASLLPRAPQEGCCVLLFRQGRPALPPQPRQANRNQKKKGKAAAVAEPSSESTDPLPSFSFLDLARQAELMGYAACLVANNSDQDELFTMTSHHLPSSLPLPLPSSSSSRPAGSPSPGMAVDPAVVPVVGEEEGLPPISGINCSSDTVTGSMEHVSPSSAYVCGIPVVLIPKAVAQYIVDIVVVTEPSSSSSSSSSFSSSSSPSSLASPSSPSCPSVAASDMPASPTADMAKTGSIAATTSAVVPSPHLPIWVRIGQHPYCRRHAIGRQDCFVVPDHTQHRQQTDNNSNGINISSSNTAGNNKHHNNNNGEKKSMLNGAAGVDGDEDDIVPLLSTIPSLVPALVPALAHPPNVETERGSSGKQTEEDKRDWPRACCLYAPFTVPVRFENSVYAAIPGLSDRHHSSGSFKATSAASST